MARSSLTSSGMAIMTRLYNTQTEQFISREFHNGYRVDGKKPELPDHIVELEIVIQQRPTITESDNIQQIRTIDLENKQVIVGWEVTPKSEEELADLEQENQRQQRHQTASAFLENVDIDNMTQAQLVNAVKALIVINRP